jgi:hypothetical protein
VHPSEEHSTVNFDRDETLVHSYGESEVPYNDTGYFSNVFRIPHSVEDFTWDPGDESDTTTVSLSHTKPFRSLCRTKSEFMIPFITILSYIVVTL